MGWKVQVMVFGCKTWWNLQVPEYGSNVLDGIWK